MLSRGLVIISIRRMSVQSNQTSIRGKSIIILMPVLLTSMLGQIPSLVDMVIQCPYYDIFTRRLDTIELFGSFLAAAFVPCVYILVLWKEGIPSSDHQSTTRVQTSTNAKSQSDRIREQKYTFVRKSTL